MTQFPIAYLNSNDGTGLLAFGEGETIEIQEKDKITLIDEFIEKQKGSFVFGFLSYDLKNNIYDLTSNNTDTLNFPNAFLWRPKYVIRLQKENFEFVQGEKNSESYDFLTEFLEEETDQNYHKNDFSFKPTISKEKYLKTVLEIKEKIQLGEVYEVNYCQEFIADDVEVSYLLDTYFKLNKITQAPFSSYIQFDDKAVFCGSPERFLKKTDQHLISQPIKGTASRGKNELEDAEKMDKLKSDPKERAENIMIVDLVRNDLSKIAEKKTVVVEELCEIYTFETVHQMISTIGCTLKENTSFSEVLNATFPMGSMTGAPKLSAMNIIEEKEDFKRGLYSGSIGYIDPNGDFDFNVVIRSLLYNQTSKHLSCSVGGAITINSIPENEYEECMTKVQRILDMMNA